jgi:hypothetical protein
MQYDKTSFFVLYYVNFWFELVNHEMFDMEFKTSTLHIFVIFHLKMNFCQYFNLLHTYGHHL